MVTTSLVEAAVKAGKHLGDRLRKAGHAPKFSAWLHDQESNEWRLVFVLDEVEQLGIRATLKIIQDAFKASRGKLLPIEFMDVDIVAPSAPLAKQIELAWQSAAPSSRKHLLRVGGFQAQDRFLDEGIVYPRSAA